jgi:excinuclease UvrABC ATPase subunit
MGYKLSQAATLREEAQRIKIARGGKAGRISLHPRRPTVRLHAEDVRSCSKVINKLVLAGNTVLVVGITST